MPSQNLRGKIPLEQIERTRIAGAPVETAVKFGTPKGDAGGAKSMTPEVQESLQARRELMNQINEVTDRQMTAQLEVAVEQSELQALEVRNRREDAEEEREQRRTSRMLMQQQMLRTMGGGMDSAAQVAIQQMQQQLADLKGSETSALVRMVDELKQRIETQQKLPDRSPMDAIREVQQVLEVSKTLKDVLGVTTQDVAREADLRAEALKFQQELELADRAAERRIRELEADERRLEGEHRREMERESKEQLGTWIQGILEVVKNLGWEEKLGGLLGGSSTPAAPVAAPQNVIPMPPRHPAPPADEVVTPLAPGISEGQCPACGVTLRAHQSQNFVVCPGCNQLLDLTQQRPPEEPDEPPPPPPALPVDRPIVGDLGFGEPIDNTPPLG